MESEKKRRKYSSSSNDSDATDIHVTSWSRCSKNMNTNSTWARQEDKPKKPSEVFRTDFITAMKLPDSSQLSPDEFYILTDPWRQEWEKGVQVPAMVEAIPEPVVRALPEVSWIPFCSASQSILSGFQSSKPGHVGMRTSAEQLSRYDLDDCDVCWLELVNTEFREQALPELDELTMERVIEELESQCYENMQIAIETEEGLGIEYDEDVVCDVCRSPEGEDGNEMVFCDKCNICVHQACYGILKVPTGNWLCRTCALGVQPKCLLCPRRGGALKPTRSGTKWVHVSCALWIPECSMPSCVIAFHVTCAFNHSLEMRTILAENDEVRFKSYCLDHSSNLHSGAGTSKGEQPPGDGTTEPRVLQQQQQEKIDKMELEKASQRKQKLQELEDEFYRLVNPADVSESLGLPDAHVDFLYQFWKLKRKSNFNQPLLTPKQDEVDNLAQQEQDVLYKRLKLFTHLRQDLERVRNLCYMVTRREKMKHSLCHLQEKVFHLQIQLIEEDLAREKAGKGGKAAKGRQSEVRGRRKCSPEKNERWKPENGSLLKQLGEFLRTFFMGLSKTFPIDEALFNSWLAQSVQITTEDMLSQWSLHDRHEEKTASLLSDQLLQGEESLLSLMMDHSMSSTWKTPQVGRRAKGKPRGKSRKTSSSSSSRDDKGGHSEEAGTQEKRASKRASNHIERSKSSKTVHHHHYHHRRNSMSKQDPSRKGSPQPPVSKMDSCHISEERSHWVDRKEPAQEPKYPVKVPEAVSAPKTVVRFRLPKQGKSKSKACSQDQGNGTEHIEKDSFDNETDGYYSDAEMSDSDTQSSNGRMRLGQLHSGTEDLVRRSVLAS
ncbi:E3 ubiquitin-protein ligase Jade-2-like isoform X3 [Polyodon spathula]|uniref:E3 ubiquitin-protein ligase Jade-2-like isoform X3 n=1 Tax=Polyodon spathula TaxID=7913 RepID=UPI001B7EE311|nr:E3 ubiquitin-protein ligase Jade-2-like isoform X3 [Polyodon spathula]